MDVFVAGRKLKINPAQSIGKGGEADVFDIGGGQALKLFKRPDHPDLQGQPPEQQAARERLATHQQKLRAFPLPLPDRVVQPVALVTNNGGGEILGYTMPLIGSAEALLRYADRGFRASGVPANAMVGIFRDLHETVAAVHRAGVVIGDFNDLNVLVSGEAAYLIDADSFQFGPFYCTVFTSRFVDPLLCDPQAKGLMLCQPHNADSDWYAFAVMLMQCLLYVDPYGGVYRPKNPAGQVPHDRRPLQRITVFHPEIRYPKPALPYRVLPDELLAYFQQVFVEDQRGDFPNILLDSLRWTKCLACGSEHARAVCPFCQHVAVAAIKAVTTVRGEVTATRVFRTAGLILAATKPNEELRWLFHENGTFKREDGSVVCSGELDPRMRFRLMGNKTVIGRGGQVVTVVLGEPPQRLAVDSVGSWTAFAANERWRYWTAGGQLQRDGAWGPEYIGDVLSGQTLFWVGEEFGFGFYRAGDLNFAFVFDAQRRGLNDGVMLPPLRGQVIDATGLFAKDRCWFFVATREGGRTIHRGILIRQNGTVEGTAEAERGDGSWLGTLRGKCAAGPFLLCATDEGIVRVEADGGRLTKTREFPDTEPFVDSSCQLLPGPQGVYVVKAQEIWQLQVA